MLRHDVVERLVQAATEGMLAVADGTSGGEVLSAYMTLALRAVIYAKEQGCDMAPFRAAIQKIYAALPEEKVN